MPGFNSVSVNLHRPGPIGDETPSTGAFTTLNASGNFTAGGGASLGGNTLNLGGVGSVVRNGTTGELMLQTNADSVTLSPANSMAKVNGALTTTSPIKPASYTLSTLPSASSFSGFLTIVSNPASGKRGDVLSNGANWLYPDNSVAA